MGDECQRTARRQQQPQRHQHKIDHQRAAVVADQRQHGEHNQHHHADRQFGQRKQLGLATQAQFGPDFCGKIVAEIAQSSQQDIDQHQRDQARSEAAEQGVAGRAIHRHALGAFGNVRSAGWGQRGQPEQAEPQHRHKQCAGDGGHPPFTGKVRIHHHGADRFDHTRRYDKAGTQHRADQVGHAPPFDKAEHHAPDHAECDAVDEHGGNVPRRRDHRKQHQCSLCNQALQQDSADAAMRGQFGNHAHADQFRQRVTHDLRDHENDFVIERQDRRQSGKMRGRKGLAKSVDRKIGAERHQPGISAEHEGWRLFQPDADCDNHDKASPGFWPAAIAAAMRRITGIR